MLSRGFVALFQLYLSRVQGTVDLLGLFYIKLQGMCTCPELKLEAS
jgi:hypothetical protein